jgi:hypothetical protein
MPRQNTTNLALKALANHEIYVQEIFSTHSTPDLSRRYHRLHTFSQNSKLRMGKYLKESLFIFDYMDNCSKLCCQIQQTLPKIQNDDAGVE